MHNTIFKRKRTAIGARGPSNSLWLEEGQRKSYINPFFCKPQPTYECLVVGGPKAEDQGWGPSKEGVCVSRGSLHNRHSFIQNITPLALMGKSLPFALLVLSSLQYVSRDIYTLSPKTFNSQYLYFLLSKHLMFYWEA